VFLGSKKSYTQDTMNICIAKPIVNQLIIDRELKKEYKKQIDTLYSLSNNYKLIANEYALQLYRYDSLYEMHVKNDSFYKKQLYLKNLKYNNCLDLSNKIKKDVKNLNKSYKRQLLVSRIYKTISLSEFIAIITLLVTLKL